MPKVVATVYIPIVSGFPENNPFFQIPQYKFFKRLYPTALKEIEALSGILKANLKELGNSPIEISQIPDYMLPLQVKRKWHAFKTKPVIDFQFLKFQKTISWSLDEVDLNTWKGVPRSEIVRMITENHCDNFLKSIYDLLLISNIAKPGAIEARECFLFKNKEFLGDREGLHVNFSECVGEEYDWPPFREVSIEKMWKWACQIPGFEDGMPQGPLGRAIAAISYLAHSGIEEQLIWALLGLEALYGQDSVGIKSQLLQKSEVFLGKKVSNKKAFGRIYDFRSRLLHGDIDFPLNHDIYDAREETFSHDVYDASLMAKAVLLATLQEMCHRNLHRLDFTFILNDSKDEDEANQNGT